MNDIITKAIIGGTVKNPVFRAVKSVKNLVKIPAEFADAANLLPSISSINLPMSEILMEPLEIANAIPIPETFKYCKITILPYQRFL